MKAIKRNHSSMVSNLNSETVRYNPDTDKLEIFYNGIWNSWKTCNLQNFYFVRNGQIVNIEPVTTSKQCTTIGQISGTNSFWDIQVDPVLTKLDNYIQWSANENHSSSDGSSYTYITTLFFNKEIDITDYDKLFINFEGLSKGTFSGNAATRPRIVLGVAQSKPNSTYTMSKHVSQQLSNTSFQDYSLELNLRDVSGFHYITLYAYWASGINYSSGFDTRIKELYLV